MWKLYQAAKTTASRPSDIMCIEDRLAAYLFDSAVVTFGTIVENATQEMEKRGPEDHPRWEPKYKLSQLLDPAFRLPTDEDEPLDIGGIDGMTFDEV